MPRLQIVEPSTDTGPGAELLNGPLKNKQINIFKGMATNPGVLKNFLAYAGGIKTGALSNAEHEVVQLVMAEENRCEYCLAAHTQVGLGAGLSEDEIMNVRRGETDNPKHQAIIDFTTMVWQKNGYVSDDELDMFKAAGFDDAAVIEVIAEMSVAAFTNIFNHVNETEVDFPQAVAVS